MAFEIRLPDLGDFKDVEIIEIHAALGEKIEKEAALITIESDKASMEVPSPAAGTIAKLPVKVGDRINEGDLLALLEETSEAAAPEKEATQPAASKPDQQTQTGRKKEAAGRPADAPEKETTVKVPDIGDFQQVEVIEVAAASGDTVAINDTLITMESDKASMDLPSPVAGTIVRMLVAAGDKVAAGTDIAVISTAALATSQPSPAAAEKEKPQTQPQPAAPRAAATVPAAAPGSGKPHASPAVRKIAREFGADLASIAGSGPKGRILKQDVQNHIKQRLRSGGSGLGFGYGIPEPAAIDFAAYGPVTVEKLSRIKRISGPALHRNWLTMPHVTQFDEADITELEEFRREHSAEARQRGFKMLPLLAFLFKACSVALRTHPRLNCSLSSDGGSVIMKNYWHIGMAVDTPGGLVVPVIRDVDSKTVMQIAEEMSATAGKAREGKLSPEAMRGGTFTVSSLGGIGGGHFTPIVNHPEVAILGVGRSQIKPVHDGEQFVPRLILPLALSYDHRVVDGAEGARFIVHLSSLLGDIRNVLL